MKFPNKITAKRIILKRPFPATMKLAQELYQVIDESRETLRPWLPWVDNTHKPEDEYKFYLINWCQKHWEEGKGYAYLIHDKETNQIIGTIDIFKIDEENKSGEIGYWLSNQAVGKGIMQEAVHALEEVAFKAGINRIVIGNDTTNLRSVHVPQNAGYHLEGVMREDVWDEFHHRFRDTNIWSKLKSDWKKNSKS